MPKSNGLFDSFDNLDAIAVDSLIPWLKNPPTPVQLENYLANKILYPLTIPLTNYEMKIDLAILREALRINGPSLGQRGEPLLGNNSFLNITLRKIIIPKRFLHFVPNLVSLTWAFVDGLLLHNRREKWSKDLWTVVVTEDVEEIVGSVLLPQFANLGDSMKLSLLGRDYQIKAGSLSLVGCPKSKCEIAYGENTVEVCGGELGLMIDGRI